MLQNFPPTRLHVPLQVRSAIAIILIAGGLGLRWLAILEEATLREHLGDAYVEYSRRTKRLIPRVI